MALYHWFWGILATSALAWYSTITVYIAYRGVFDIQHMLQKLSSGDFHGDSAEAPASTTPPKT
jgi:hypothetical protein